jgi:hypothetical protein
MTSRERLTEIVQQLTWESCERFDDGHFRMIDIQVEEQERQPIDFYLRVGLYMNRPVQTIIAEGNFLCFRSGKKWETLPLKQVDSKLPMSSLYIEDQYASQYGQIGTIGWPPPPHLAGISQGLSTSQKLVWDPTRSLETQMRLQAAMMQAQMQQYKQQVQIQQAYANIPCGSTTSNNTNPILSSTGGWSNYLSSLQGAFQNLFGSKQTP